MSRIGKNEIVELLEKVFYAPGVKAALGLVVAAFFWVFPENQFNSIFALYLLIFVDTLTGLNKAWVKSSLSSGKFFRVAIKSVLYMALLVTASMLDKVVGFTFELSLPVMLMFLVITEAISILENISEAGWPVPLILLGRLRVMRSEADDNDSK
jgi:toxin secretion/phage lysis holin